VNATYNLIMLVSKCCGADYMDIKDSYGDSQVVCKDCEDICETQNEYDYDDLMRGERAEADADDERLGL